MRIITPASVIIPCLGFSASSIAVIEDMMIVSAPGYERKLINAAVSVSVISQGELQSSQYHDLAEALRPVEDADVESDTGKAGGLEISIRETPASYMPILIDGVRQGGGGDVTPNSFSAIDTGFIPPLTAIERIEVIRGSTFTPYGSGAMGGVVNIITRKNADKWLSSVNVGLNLQESNRWGSSSQFSFWSSGLPMDDSVSLQVRGNAQRRQGSLVTSLGDTATTCIPRPTESQNYNLGARLDWKALAQDVLWFDMGTTRQCYDSRDGRLESLTGGYGRTLRHERNKISVGYDHTFTFGIQESCLNRDETENKGCELIRNVLKRDRWGLVGQSWEPKESNLTLNSLLFTSLGESHLVMMRGEFQGSSMKDGVVLANAGETFRQKSWSIFAEGEWRLTNALALTMDSCHEHYE